MSRRDRGPVQSENGCASMSLCSKSSTGARQRTKVSAHLLATSRFPSASILLSWSAMRRTNLVLSLALASLVGCTDNSMMGDDGGDGGGGGSGSRPPMTDGVSTLAGYSNPGYQDGNRQVNLFNNPVNVLFGPDGKLYAADFDNSKLRVIDMDGNASTVIAKQNFSRPFGMVFVGTTLYVSTDRDGQGQHDPVGSTEQMHGTIWRVDVSARTATVVAEKIGRPRSLAALSDGRIAVADYAHHVIQILDPASGTLTPLAGTWNAKGFADGAGGGAQFSEPYGIVQRADGKLVVADFGNHRIRLVALDGTVTTLAGSTAGFADGSGGAAKLNHPQGVALASNGDIYITDIDNYRVRKLSGDSVTTISGDGTPGYKDDDSKAAAQFYGLEGISVKPDGSRIFVADGTRGEDVPYNRIRVIKN
jgi:sugar lactone lactonase YvrE